MSFLHLTVSMLLLRRKISPEKEISKLGFARANSELTKGVLKVALRRIVWQTIRENRKEQNSIRQYGQ